ncbi:MAG: 3-deoxy-D-manno-octulosonic acid transferase [Gemmataceae bacterium]
MRWILDVVYGIALVLLSPWLAWRAWRTGRYRDGIRAKLLGSVRNDVPSGAVWFHAVSLGEMKVLGYLVPAFRQRFPGRAVVVSSTTLTGLAEARRLFPDLQVIAFPFDFSWAVSRTLRSMRPSLVVLCESELWPNFLMAIRRLNIPLAVVNARMSPRSVKRFQWVAPLVRWMFRVPRVVGVQSADYAAAWLSLGATPGRDMVTGNIKFDGALTDPGNPRTEAMRCDFCVRKEDLIWVAGSTQTPEEDGIIRIFSRIGREFPSLRLFLVPRHPDRFDEVAKLLQEHGIAFVRRSQIQGSTDARVILGDTVGELSFLWGLAQVAYVGGSMDGKRGGQNMIEPAAFGAAVTYGPHVWNFRETARRLVECGGAYQVQDFQELEEITRHLLKESKDRLAMGKLGRQFVLSQQGATQRTLDILGSCLNAEIGKDRAA